MEGDADIAKVGALVADPARARILLALGDGRALPATVLADEAGVTASTASAHLSKLVAGGRSSTPPNAPAAPLSCSRSISNFSPSRYGNNSASCSSRGARSSTGESASALCSSALFFTTRGKGRRIPGQARDDSRGRP